VVQAWRQPGSSFKPFIYSASLEKGFTPSTLVNDAPISIDPDLTGGQVWEPKNYDGKFEGPLRLRQGLAKSKNLVSIRILQAIGPRYAQDWVNRFGFEADKHPAYLTMALGAGSVTPLVLLNGYSVFASGGYGLQLHLISRVTDANGRTLMEARPSPPAAMPRTGVERTQRLSDGQPAEGGRTHRYAARASATEARASVARRGPNDSHDAWFAGAAATVAVAWMGFDQPRPLRNKPAGWRRSGSPAAHVSAGSVQRRRASCSWAAVLLRRAPARRGSRVSDWRTSCSRRSTRGARQCATRSSSLTRAR
jgi:penicillin-binding protein 1A